MHPDEPRKPTNTARLIAATIPQTRLFLWRRDAPPDDFLALLRDPLFCPYLLFPGGNPQAFTDLAERFQSRPPTPAFVILDGTWTQARKMFLKSPYLHHLPRLSIRPQAQSAYTLRRQRNTQHLSTVEVAIAVLQQVQEQQASQLLTAYFQVFVASAMAARHGHTPTRALPAQQPLLAYQQHTRACAPTEEPAHEPTPDSG